MNRSILEINTPKKCEECVLITMCTIDNEKAYCIPTGKIITDIKTKPEWCPLVEERGKLLYLPLTIGETYYRIENDGANEPYIREWKANTIEFCVNAINCIGKTIFLTREAAAAALEKEVKGNEKNYI